MRYLKFGNILILLEVQEIDWLLKENKKVKSHTLRNSQKTGPGRHFPRWSREREIHSQRWYLHMHRLAK